MNTRYSVFQYCPELGCGWIKQAEFDACITHLLNKIHKSNFGCCIREDDLGSDLSAVVQGNPTGL